MLTEKDHLWLQVVKERYREDFNPWHNIQWLGTGSLQSVWWKDLKSLVLRNQDPDWF